MGLRSILVVLCFVQIGCGSQPDPLVIRNVTLVTANLDHPVVSDVLIKDGAIVAIGENLKTDTQLSIDGRNKFLVPGLIDSHTHLAEIPGMIFQQEQNFPGIAKETRQQIPKSYLYHGFTTVIDLNAVPKTIKDWNSVEIAPRAFFCGAAPVFDGYPSSYLPKPFRYRAMPYFLYDSDRADDFPKGYDPKAHTPSAIVAKIKDDGGICIKTHHERGFRGGDLPVPSLSLIQDLVFAAHSEELPVLLHANSESAQDFGVQSGVDAFAHGMWTWNDRSLTELHPGITKIVDATIDREISLQPTIQVLYGEQDIHNPSYLENPDLKHVLPASILEWYATEDGQWWVNRMLQIPIVEELVQQGRWSELDQPPIQRVSHVLQYFAGRDGDLLFGSDTPSDPTYANPPGLNGRFEMSRWIEAGVTLEQLFRALTVNNAAFFGLDDIGTIQVGKRADLLLLEANPLETLEAYGTINSVILNGRPIDRQALSALDSNQ